MNDIRDMTPQHKLFELTLKYMDGTNEAAFATVLSGSRKKLVGLPLLVADAEKHLDKAEQEFAEHAYAPFWDEVEHAINKLAAYEKGIATINRAAMWYTKNLAKATVEVLAFDLPMRELPDGRPTAHRLVAVVRQAQRDFHFAQIYEMRKTNKLLVAGFSTLASAIREVGDAISSSLDELSNTLHRSLDDLLDATRQRERVDREAADSRKRQEVMLDNIQRKRKPLP